MENSDIYEKLAKATSGTNVKLKVTDDEIPLVRNLIKDLDLTYTIEGNTISVEGKEQVIPDAASILEELGVELQDEIPEVEDTQPETRQQRRERMIFDLNAVGKYAGRNLTVNRTGKIQMVFGQKYMGLYDSVAEAQVARDKYLANPEAFIKPVRKATGRPKKQKITDKKVEAILKTHEASIKKKGEAGAKAVSNTMAISDDKFIRYTETVLNEISKINTRLGVIESNQDAMKEDMDERFGGIESKISVLSHLITGNGTPERGLIIRIDRLEQSQASRTKLLWIAIGAAVVSAVNGLITFFKGN